MLSSYKVPKSLSLNMLFIPSPGQVIVAMAPTSGQERRFTLLIVSFKQ